MFHHRSKRKSILWVLICASATLVLLFLAVTGSGALPALAASEPASGVRVMRSDDNGLLLEIQTPGYALADQLLDQRPYQQILVTGTEALLAPGRPELPKFSLLLGLPPEAEIAVRVLEDDALPVGGRVNVWPAPSPIVGGDEQGGAQRRVPDLPAYASRAWYPATVAQVVDTAWLRDQRLARLEVYPFQYQAGTRSLLWHRRLLVEVQFTGAKTTDRAEANSTPLNPFETLLSGSLLNYDNARQWRSASASRQAVTAPKLDSPTALPVRYKIVVDHDGLYRVTYTDLVSAGLDMTGLDPRNLQLSNQGLPVAMEVVGEADGQFDSGDSLVFYGQRLRGDLLAARHPTVDDHWINFNGWQPHFNATMVEKYTDENVYWLEVAAAPGLRLSTNVGTPLGAPQPEYYTATVRAEKSLIWKVTHFTSEDSWLWDELVSPTPVTRTYTTTLTAIASVPFSVTVRAEVSPLGFNPPPQPTYRTIFRLNQDKTALEDATWTGIVRHRMTTTVPLTALLEGINVFSLTLVPQSATPVPDMFFDWFDITYPRRFQAQDGVLTFTDDRIGPRQYAVTAFNTSTLQVLNISDPWQPQRIVASDVTGQAGAFTVTFQVTHTQPVTYFVTGADQLQTPKRITRYTPAVDWRSPANGADYLIITHRDFYTAMQRLADYRTAQGLRTQIVDVADLYDQFTDGIYNPIAIKDFLAYAYANWQPPAPLYVLLVGDGHWNFKGFNPARYGTAPIYMPPNLAWLDPYQGEVDSANELATIVGSDPLPDLLIGRVPVNTAAQAEIVVSKTINYETQSPDLPWRKQLLFLADNGPDPAGDFAAYSNALIQDFVHPPYTARTMYAGDYGCTNGSASTTPGCTAVRFALTSTLNLTGALFLNYIGHGANSSWGGERYLSIADIPTLDNLDRLPVILSMTCLDGYWIHAIQGSTSAGLMETMLRAANGGMVASFSPTGLGVATGHDTLERGLLNAVFNQHIARLGPATLAGKLALYRAGYYFDLIGTFTIFGDPALRLPISRFISLTATSPSTLPEVHVEWRLGPDISTRGFYVWRSLDPNGSWTQLSGLISPSPIITSSLPYQWVDYTTAPGTQYSYRVEEVLADQSNTFYGPVSVVSGVPQYTLTVTKSGTGQGSVSSIPLGLQCGLTCTVSYPLGTIVTLTAEPDADSFWGGWGGAMTSTSRWITLTMEADQAISANFVRYVPDLSLSSQLVNLSSIESGDTLIYTFCLQNIGTITAAARLTDSLPAFTQYLTDSAQASAGTVTVTDGILYWSGNIDLSGPVVIQMAATALPAATGTLITNTAELNDGQGVTWTLQAASLYNPGFRLSINDSALYTPIPTVSLRIKWGATQPAITSMFISNDADLSSGTGWVPVAETQTAWSLDTTGNWRLPRTVYVAFRDGDGKSYPAATDDIIYDPVPPQISEASFAPVDPAANTRVVHVAASDDNSGVYLVQLSNQADMSQATELAMNSAALDIPWPLPPMGLGPVFVRVVDRAGNLSVITPVQHHLTVTKSGTGQGGVSSIPLGLQCGLTCTVGYPFGTVVTLTAVPEADSFWGGWGSVMTSTSRWITLTMEADQAISANFVRYVPDLSPSIQLVNLSNIESGDTLTYTFRLQNIGTITAAARLTDSLPVFTQYLTDSAQASAGTVTVTDGILYWSGNIDLSGPVVIQMAATALPAATGTLITNTAELNDGQGVTWTLQAASLYNPGFQLSINEGALYTTIPTVSLRIKWSATQPAIAMMSISNDGGFGSGTGWVPVTETQTAWSLDTTGNWRLPRTVYVAFRDSDGKPYPAATDDIIYDPVPPQISEASFAPVDPAANTRVVHVAASDDNSGVNLVQLSNQADMSQATELTMSGMALDIPWSRPGPVFVRVVDRAGNLSASTPVQHYLYLPAIKR